ncbi:MAG: hypothetical protein GF364_10665 [Candidatus Lokiarchaeota archaeon]|nr:hypothetical protein [Candidatus Lokiarchaeota archaeon]
MMFYGNEFRVLSGVIKKIQKQSVKIKFNSDYSEGKVFSVPKNIIKSKIILKKNIPQRFKVPVWYLKRNRVIPINDNLYMKQKNT